MPVRSGRVGRRTLAIAGILLVTGCGLTACSSKSTAQGFNQTIHGENGAKSSVLFGKDAKIPPDFPKDVPVPVAGALRSVVAEANPPNASFTLTYGLGGRDGIAVGDLYRTRLEKAGFTIQNYSSIGGTDSHITQFDAIGTKWDVAVVSGKANPRDRATLSVQVHTHGPVTSGIGGIGDTTPDNSPSTTPGASSTTTTTVGF